MFLVLEFNTRLTAIGIPCLGIALHRAWQSRTLRQPQRRYAESSVGALNVKSAIDPCYVNIDINAPRMIADGALNVSRQSTQQPSFK